MGFLMHRFVRHLFRISAPLALTAAALVWSDPAGAQSSNQDITDPTGTGGSSPTGLTKADFDIQLMQKDGNTWKYFNKTVYDTFFNRARCQCDEPVRVVVRLATTSVGKVGVGARAEFRLRAGDATCVCTGANCANLNCKDLDTPRDLAALVTGGLTFDTTVRAVFEAGRPAGATGDICNRDEMQNLWLWMDSDDAGADTELTDVSYPLRLDGLPPAVPSGVKVTPGNEALSVTWDPLPYLDDLQGYVVFCSREGVKAVFPGAFKPEYNTPAALCPGRVLGALTATAAATTTTADPAALDDSAADNVMRGPAPGPIAALDPQFACSDILTSRGERRLYQLQNGIPYAVGVASIDKRGNASPIEEVVLQTPIPTRDFYNSYRKEGGTAEGGFCAVASAGGRPAPWLAAALLAPLLALLLRRTRRPR
jgi:hypothetical protein